MSGDDTERYPPELLTKGELYQEVIEIADLPEKTNTGSYAFRHEHLVELVRHLRTRGNQDV